jgi:hypothetical protein
MQTRGHSGAEKALRQIHAPDFRQQQKSFDDRFNAMKRIFVMDPKAGGKLRFTQLFYKCLSAFSEHG